MINDAEKELENIFKKILRMILWVLIFTWMAR
jgi:hypothetical protein